MSGLSALTSSWAVCPGVLHRRRRSPGEDAVECGGEVAVPVADQEPQLPGPLASFISSGRGTAGPSRPCRVRGDVQDVHGPGLDLHHEHDICTGAGTWLSTCRNAVGRAKTPAAAPVPGRRRPGSGDRSLPTGAPWPSNSPRMRRYPGRILPRASAPPAPAPRPGLRPT